MRWKLLIDFALCSIIFLFFNQKKIVTHKSRLLHQRHTSRIDWGLSKIFTKNAWFFHNFTRKYSHDVSVFSVWNKTKSVIILTNFMMNNKGELVSFRKKMLIHISLMYRWVIWDKDPLGLTVVTQIKTLFWEPFFKRNIKDVSIHGAS